MSASVLQTRDAEGSRVAAATSRPTTPDLEFYWVGDSHRCKRCPRGHYVKEHCVNSDEPSTCLPCKEGCKYMAYASGFKTCFLCRVCRRDQVEVRPCTRTSNRECACRNGTYCTPDQPCEMCHKCQTSCPKGGEVVKPCTPYNDIQCGHSIMPTPAPGTFAGLAVGITVLVTVVIIALVVLAVWCCCFSGDKEKSSVLTSKLLSQLMNSTRSRGTWDNHRNQKMDKLLVPQEQAGQPDPMGLTAEASHPELQVVQTSAAPEVKGWKKLVPVEGDDLIETLRRSFYYFAEEVPCKDWKRFGRRLHLTENEIMMAEKIGGDTLEQYVQILATWVNKEGTGSSVNTLLETLDRIHLRGVAQSVCNKLIQDGLYKYEDTSPEADGIVSFCKYL
ncbi:PREDICTED: tumor necrosis factor receptor superfamily member 10B-like [Crocodylus porosus]|uniref:tumor necrosis factor receptor superfamily member 10B-like n=1 Tax=Crocodylus porosus TaxID=8502 RepID=UPI00093BDBB6|nr:PREDICTED: tumor necrosis factor receptor superfamily member 10B-like [Crocodylus porosus]